MITRSEVLQVGDFLIHVYHSISAISLVIRCINTDCENMFEKKIDFQWRGELLPLSPRAGPVRRVLGYTGHFVTPRGEFGLDAKRMSYRNRKIHKKKKKTNRKRRRWRVRSHDGDKDLCANTRAVTISRPRDGRRPSWKR